MNEPNPDPKNKWNVTWKRAFDVFPKNKFFGKNGISPQDIN